MTIAAQARVVEWPGAGIVLQLCAILAMSFGLSMLYIVMPYTKVRVPSALLGGLVAGVLWYVTLVLHVVLQLGVARYNAIYSTFAALPMFLIWVFVSWLVVIFGAEITAAHQNMGAFRWRVRGKEADYAAKEYVAVRAMVAIGDAFVAGKAPPTLQELACLMRVPDKLVEEVLDVFVKRGILVKTTRGAYVIIRDLQKISVTQIVDAMKHDSEFSVPPPATVEDASVRAVLHALDRTIERSSRNLNLRELVDAAHEHASSASAVPGSVAPAPPEDDEEAVSEPPADPRRSTAH
jgi:membrane protein